MGAITSTSDGVLWAHPSPNAKGLVEIRPLDGLRINSLFCGSEGAFAENIDFIRRAVSTTRRCGYEAAASDIGKRLLSQALCLRPMFIHSLCG